MTGSHGTVEANAYVIVLPEGWINVLIEETEDSRCTLGHGKGSPVAQVGKTQHRVLLIKVPHLSREIPKRACE